MITYSFIVVLALAIPSILCFPSTSTGEVFNAHTERVSVPSLESLDTRDELHTIGHDTVSSDPGLREDMCPSTIALVSPMINEIMDTNKAWATTLRELKVARHRSRAKKEDLDGASDVQAAAQAAVEKLEAGIREMEGKIQKATKSLETHTTRYTNAVKRVNNTNIALTTATNRLTTAEAALQKAAQDVTDAEEIGGASEAAARRVLRRVTTRLNKVKRRKARMENLLTRAQAAAAGAIAKKDGAQASVDNLNALLLVVNEKKLPADGVLAEAVKGVANANLVLSNRNDLLLAAITAEHIAFQALCDAKQTLVAADKDTCPFPGELTGP